MRKGKWLYKVPYILVGAIVIILIAIISTTALFLGWLFTSIHKITLYLFRKLGQINRKVIDY